MKALELLAFHLGFFLGEDFWVEGLFELEQMPEVAGHGGAAFVFSIFTVKIPINPC